VLCYGFDLGSCDWFLRLPLVLESVEFVGFMFCYLCYWCFDFFAGSGRLVKLQRFWLLCVFYPLLCSAGTGFIVRGFGLGSVTKEQKLVLD